MVLPAVLGGLATTLVLEVQRRGHARKEAAWREAETELRALLAASSEASDSAGLADAARRSATVAEGLAGAEPSGLASELKAIVAELEGKLDAERRARGEDARAHKAQLEALQRRLSSAIRALMAGRVAPPDLLGLLKGLGEEDHPLTRALSVEAAPAVDAGSPEGAAQQDGSPRLVNQPATERVLRMLGAGAAKDAAEGALPALAGAGAQARSRGIRKPQRAKKGRAALQDVDGNAAHARAGAGKSRGAEGKRAALKAADRGGEATKGRPAKALPASGAPKQSKREWGRFALKVGGDGAGKKTSRVAPSAGGLPSNAEEDFSFSPQGTSIIVSRS